GVAFGHEQAEHPVGAERARTERGYERAVHAAREAYDDPAPAQPLENLPAYRGRDARRFGGGVEPQPVGRKGLSRIPLDSLHRVHSAKNARAIRRAPGL